jgi:MFS transporter, SHS family, sialic acid transporter
MKQPPGELPTSDESTQRIHQEPISAATASPPAGVESAPGLSTRGRYLVLVVAFLGWFLAGTQLSITSLVVRPASISLLAKVGEVDQSLVTQKPKEVSTEQKPEFDRQSKQIAYWVTWQTCAFLFGAAFGGLVLGWVGDRFGRTKGMAASILFFSGCTLLGYWVETPVQLIVLRFIASMGIGGMWPNGIALAAEAWSGASRPLLSGVIGTAANVGIMLFSLIAGQKQITPDDWRWTMLWLGTPILLGLFALVAVPESPRWLWERDERRRHTGSGTLIKAVGISEIFRPPLLGLTLLGIAIGSVPIFGGWGCANWAAQWADKVGALADPHLKAHVNFARSFTGSISSFLGGWFASRLGRKRSYFWCCIAALASGEAMFMLFSPEDKNAFLILTATLGFFSGVFFGWLPLCLPELFPTRVRSTGAGVSFNFGRVVTAFGVLATTMLVAVQGEDYPLIGRVTSLVYLVGAIIIWFAPLQETDELRD